MKYYADENAFKLFACDLGLMGAMTDTKAADVLSGGRVFEEYKGAFTEQYIFQQFLAATGKPPYYYTNNRSTMEIDFAAEGTSVYAIEVKAEENLRSKSLKTVLADYPDITGWRFSMSSYREQERLINIPLFLAEEWFRAHGD